MSAEPVYWLRDVVKSYGPREVCRVAELALGEGELLGIMGPNGAGKSTLLRLLAFLEAPDAGDLRFRGHFANGQVPLGLRRQVTMVFQEPALLSASVAANVAYGLKVRGEKDIPQRVGTALAQVRLTHLAQAHASTLSGGEMQRVALARALVLRPQVLLLDEPTANLDPYNVALIENLIREVNQRQQTTVVLVTHNVFQARRLAHRIVMMLEGQVIEVGETNSLFSQPQDPRTLAFIRGELVC